MRRSTFRIRDAVQRVNLTLEQSTCAPAIRQGITLLLETMLHETGNYNGFGYLTAAEVPPGQLPGIVRGYTDGEIDNTKNTYPDETRRFYYLPR